jgi:hypothetical protein
VAYVALFTLKLGLIWDGVHELAKQTVFGPNGFAVVLFVCIPIVQLALFSPSLAEDRSLSEAFVAHFNIAMAHLLHCVDFISLFSTISFADPKGEEGRRPMPQPLRWTILVATLLAFVANNVGLMQLFFRRSQMLEALSPYTGGHNTSETSDGSPLRSAHGATGGGPDGAPLLSPGQDSPSSPGRAGGSLFGVTGNRSFNGIPDAPPSNDRSASQRSSGGYLTGAGGGPSYGPAGRSSMGDSADTNVLLHHQHRGSGGGAMSGDVGLMDAAQAVENANSERMALLWSAPWDLITGSGRARSEHERHLLYMVAMLSLCDVPFFLIRVSTWARGFTVLDVFVAKNAKAVLDVIMLLTRSQA